MEAPLDLGSRMWRTKPRRGAIPNPQSGCDKDFEEVPIVIPDSQSGDESSNLSSGRKKNGKDKRQ